MKRNFILLADSYKIGHFRQYPPNTQFVYSYFESRGGRFDKIIFYSLQIWLKRYLAGKVFDMADVEEANTFAGQHLGDDKAFNYEGWKALYEKYQGKLPLEIRAVKEGTEVPTKNVLMTIVNTDPEFFWLSQYIEGIIQQIWYGCTVATFSKEVRKLLRSYYLKNTDHVGAALEGILDFMFHNFGFRSCTSVEQAEVGDGAHLISFKGTDTMAGIKATQYYYNTKAMLGFSVNATEHSTTTSWGRENEAKAYKHFLTTFNSGILSIVADSYGIKHACGHIFGEELKDLVLSREGKLVIRPDSGHPAMTLRTILPILFGKFGGTINKKGMRILNTKVGVIQGDGVNYESMKEILDMLEEIGFSPENVVFGCGTVLMQNHNRDTQKFAIKCSAITIDGVVHSVVKDPLEINEQGFEVKSFKTSKAGFLKLVKDDVLGYRTVTSDMPEFATAFDELVLVFRNGEIVKEYSFEEVRENAIESALYYAGLAA